MMQTVSIQYWCKWSAAGNNEKSLCPVTMQRSAPDNNVNSQHPVTMQMIRDHCLKFNSCHTCIHALTLKKKPHQETSLNCFLLEQSAICTWSHLARYCLLAPRDQDTELKLHRRIWHDNLSSLIRRYGLQRFTALCKHTHGFNSSWRADLCYCGNSRSALPWGFRTLFKHTARTGESEPVLTMASRNPITLLYAVVSFVLVFLFYLIAQNILVRFKILRKWQLGPWNTSLMMKNDNFLIVFIFWSMVSNSV